ncbi:hypothetical protein EHI_065230 [Entamoeba histolytica HM-1:IMSS]|uniref:Uncharacterized protein n=5 Tax=Entamoeba histolytica TaxID=5759 RepID=B1N400_ENTH1|nr:hypothetical protein EHI_065230 [Entamoeba histolytica HM-1:IMSS]EDS89307.1 hypothetical protein EHI_065230 [Entamoeba histolytica HM-1:IMSS]|eukprot:XP_001913916.1 hypothetical protein EHI_065230 [Entamoeba histolytica HM-1:IMSS]
MRRTFVFKKQKSGLQNSANISDSQNLHQLGMELSRVYCLQVAVHSGEFLEGETGIYCVCKINEKKYRTMTTVGNKPSFNETWSMTIPEDTVRLTIEVCKHNKLNSRQVIGVVQVSLKRLGINVETTEKYTVASFNGSEIGKLLLTFKRFSREDEKELIGEKPQKARFSLVSSSMEDLESLVSDTLSKSPLHRKKFMPQLPSAKDRETVEACGLFSAVFTVTVGDIAEDLLHFMNNEQATFNDIEQVGLTGVITNCYPPNNGGKIVPLNIWNFCFGDGLRVSRTNKNISVVPFVMTDAMANTKYACFLIAYFKIEKEMIKKIQEIIPKTPDELYAPYAVGVTSDFPLHTFMRKWLKSLYEINVENDMKFTDYCHQVIFMTGKPSFGNLYSYDFGQLGFKIEIQLPCLNGLPPIPTSILPLFEMIGIDGVLAVWLALLEGEKVIITSTSKTALVYSIENLKSLLFPFEWCNICIDSLPYSLIDYVSSPMTYLMGVPSEYKEDVEKIIKNEEVVYVDLDSGVVKSKGIIREVPKLINTVYHELKDVFNKREYSNGNINSDIFDEKYYLHKSEEFNCAVRIILFKFINVMLNEYRDYIGYTWIADKESVVFSSEEFIYNQPSDRRDFLKALFESQHFSFFLQNFPKRHDHIFEDWQINNIYLINTNELIQMYSKEYHPITSIIQTSTEKSLEVSPINTLVLDCGKLKSLRVRNTVVNSQLEPKMYHNHLEGFKKQRVREVFNNDIIQFSDIQIGILVMMNEGTTKSLDTDLLFNFLSQVEGRKIFTQRLMSKYTSFCINKMEGRINNIVYAVIGDILRQEATYAYSQKDYMTPQHIIELSQILYKIEGNQKIKLINSLIELDIWNQMDVWNNMFMRLMCIGKSSIYQEQYGLDLPSRWNLFDSNQQTQYRIAETQDFKKNLSTLLDTMKIVRVNDKTLNQFVGYILSQMRFDEIFRKEIDKLVKEKCPSQNSLTINDSKEQLLADMRKLYDSVYLTED